MPPLSNIFAGAPRSTLAVLAMAGVLTACAQPQESAQRYDTSRENTQRDARNKVLGEGPRAASQIQLGFGETAPRNAQAAEAGASGASGASALPRPLAEARSF